MEGPSSRPKDPYKGKRGLLSEALRSLLTLVTLAALTWGELQVSSFTGGSILILLLFSISKAALIVYFFMHIYRLWRTH